MEEGEIEIDSIEPIGLPDITGQLARESGFLGVIDLLKVAKHGKGQNIYLVRFHYVVLASSGQPGANLPDASVVFQSGISAGMTLLPCRR